MKYNFHHNRFEELHINPHKLAVSGSDRDISWIGLHDMVERFGELFKQAGIPCGHPVMIHGHKEALFPVAILACMHAGIPYIPIDLIYPAARIRMISQMTGSQAIITCGETVPMAGFPIQIDKNLQLTRDGIPNFTDAVYGDPLDPLRYIMFTSGSTGEPKGVQITRSAIISFTDWIEHDYPFKDDDVFVNQSPFTFDVSLYDTLSAFLLGASVLLVSKELASDSAVFFRKLKQYNASIWTSTPSFAYLFLREPGFSRQELPQLRIFLFAGEHIPVKTCHALWRNFPECRIFNAYGPTEATVTTTLVELTSDLLAGNPLVPIGYEKRDSVILIDGDPERTGQQGEMIIVGDHVSTGYFNNEEQNRARFFTWQGKRAFRTGDLGYYRGDLLYLTGRNDGMIKFHGYRIELGEIMTALQDLQEVEDAVATPLTINGEIKRIVAFVILNEEYKQRLPEIRSQIIRKLEQRLPGYMIPGDLIERSEFPVNQNHKIDPARLIREYMEPTTTKSQPSG